LVQPQVYVSSCLDPKNDHRSQPGDGGQNPEAKRTGDQVQGVRGSRISVARYRTAIQGKMQASYDHGASGAMRNCKELLTF